ncbi:BTAD domain-containing putative transcriptional regulator [Salinispora arenicola]|uniref:BTAD domain-containing putative transcriptional regulator n=1 Tax=Salinispora arenicola TaxID=168697 RepID=UPI00039DF823
MSTSVTDQTFRPHVNPPAAVAGDPLPASGARSVGHTGMKVRLLGPTQAWLDGVELSLGSGNRTAVLSFLALHANHGVTREQLIAALWGDSPPASATGNIYTYVSALRHILEPCRHRWAAGQVLTSGGGTYRLQARAQDIDVLQFNALREEGKRHRRARNHDAELASLTAALGLWHGEALAGVPGPFAEAQRQRLTELRLTTAERRATLLIETGRHDEAISVLRVLVEAHPARESLHPLLAAALHAAGRAVSRERQSPPGKLSGGAGRRRVLPVCTDFGSLVGRTPEIRRLRWAVAQAVRGRGRSIRVEGFTGMGKSALLTVALKGPTSTNYRIGWAVGRELSRRVPLGLLVECVESALADETGSDLAKALSLDSTTSVEDSATELVGRMVGLVRQIAEQAPLILIADGLHWADPQTVQVWTALHELTAHLPLLLVATGWPGSAELRDTATDEVLTLAPLSSAASAHLVCSAAPEPLDARELDHLLTAAGGNPCYLWHLATSCVSDWNAPLPASLVNAVRSHLTPFDEKTREALRAAAFLGAEPTTDVEFGCDLDELALVTDRPTDELRRLLLPTVWAGLITIAGERLAFRHQVVARVLHQGTAGTLRSLLHRSFAERIAQADGPPERVVAQLLAGAVPLDDALIRWLTVHVEQLSADAPRITVMLLQRAHAQYAVSPGDRMVLTIWLARLLLRLGRNCAAEAGWVASRTDDPDVEGEMRWMVALTYEKRGEHETAADIARAVLDERHVPATWLDRFRLMQIRLRQHLGDRHGSACSKINPRGKRIPEQRRERGTR